MVPEVSMALAPLIAAAAAYFTRARRDRILIALAGGVVFALGNVGWDALADRLDWWRYPDGVNVVWYVAVAVAFAGVSLIAWRVDLRYRTRGLVWFFVLFSIYGLVRDFIVARFEPELIVFGGGFLPWVMDIAAWLTLSIFAVGVQIMIRPEPGAEGLRRSLMRRTPSPPL